MGITSRQKRPLDRRITHLRDTNLIIIAVEGTETEKQYFESYIFQNRRVQVKVLPTTGGLSAPTHVLARLKKFATETELHENDQLWLMVDKDRWTDEHLSSVCSAAIRGKRNKAFLSISNPSFELWLYLHFNDWTKGSCTSSEMEKSLREIMGAYNKSNIEIGRFKEGIDSAIVRAKTLDTSPLNRWPANPGTHVYRVVEAIRKMSI
ncbi:MAG: RloB domain-containing protein [Clostridiales bacterium]|nr:RloB domain-containing protein [Clostridiales bacterium]